MSSVKSRVGIMVGDKIHSVHVGYHGWIFQGVGTVLLERFDTEDKVLKLIKGGAIRTLTKTNVDYYNDKCFYDEEIYEDKTLYDVDSSITEFIHRTKSRRGAYYYVMENGQWFCGDTSGSLSMSSKLVPLQYAIEQERMEIEQERMEIEQDE